MNTPQLPQVIKAVGIIVCLLVVNHIHAQNKEAATKLIEEGIKLYDQKEYANALLKYDQALTVDKNNLVAFTEKTMTLLTQKQYGEAIKVCQKAIETHPKDTNLRIIYVSYATAEDELNHPKEALKIYNEGINQFPKYYQLYFNKGISLTKSKNELEALGCFEQSAMLNPTHAASHNAIAHIESHLNNRIPAIMAYCRYLSIEPQVNRSKENLDAVIQLMMNDTMPKTNQADHTLDSIELAIATIAKAMREESRNKKKIPIETFHKGIHLMCSALAKAPKGNKGFIWDYYAPYFIELQEKKFLTTFSYIAFLSTEDPIIFKWFNAHKLDIEAFINWSKTFTPLNSSTNLPQPGINPGK